MLCLFLPPADTMDVVNGRRLDSLSRLKCISGTEIFFGLINLLVFVVAIILVISRSASATHFTWSWSLILNVTFYFFLFFTGCFGVHIVNRCRRTGSGSSRTFSVLAGLNIILCIIYSIFLLLVIVSGILIAVASHYIHTVWEHLATSLGWDKSTFTESKTSDTFTDSREPQVLKNAEWFILTAVGIVLAIMGLFLLMFAVLTGMAAKISRRNAAILSTPVVSTGYNDSLLATSMGGTYQKAAPTYGEYHAVKQHI